MLTLNVEPEDVSPSQDLVYRAPDGIHEEMQHRKTALTSKLETARHARQASQGKSQLPGLLENPSALVGKRITHLCHVPGQKPKWYSGTVLDMGDIDAQPEKIQYTVHYDEDPAGENWHFPLLRDLDRGALVVEIS